MTITSGREKTIDFTHPVLYAGLRILYKVNSGGLRTGLMVIIVEAGLKHTIACPGNIATLVEETVKVFSRRSAALPLHAIVDKSIKF